jgi:hypothetical protein
MPHAPLPPKLLAPVLHSCLVWRVNRTTGRYYATPRYRDTLCPAPTKRT